MQDFYEEERKENEGKTRTFTFCGQQFVAKPLMAGDDVATLTDIGIDGDQNQVSRDMFNRVNRVIRNTLVASSRPTWDETIAADREIPITIGALSRLAAWLLTEEAGRPTEPLSSSGTSGESGSTTSTGASASKADEASKTSPSVPV